MEFGRGSLVQLLLMVDCCPFYLPRISPTLSWLQATCCPIEMISWHLRNYMLLTKGTQHILMLSPTLLETSTKSAWRRHANYHQSLLQHQSIKYLTAAIPPLETPSSPALWKIGPPGCAPSFLHIQYKAIGEHSSSKEDCASCFSEYHCGDRLVAGMDFRALGALNNQCLWLNW